MNLDKKLELAHECSMWFLDKNKDMAFAPNTVAYNAWQYADAMEAEAEKRIKAKAERDAEESKVFFEKLNSTDSIQLEWQPDWSQAPDWANWWAMDDCDCFWWYEKSPEMKNGGWCVSWTSDDFEKAPSFNYQGDWKQSLRKRP